MPTVEGAGVELAWSERGAGPVVLLVHGLAADARSLEGLADALRDVARVISYDRRGYGASGAPSPYGGTTVEEQAEDAAAVLAAAGDGPAVAAGVGFGALVALDLLRRHRGLVRAVALADPPLFQLVPEATEDLAGTFGRLQEAVRTGGPEAGVEAWLGGDADAGELARARAAHRAFFADWAGLSSWPATRPELRRLDGPAVVVTGPGTPAPVLAAADRLAALLPRSRRATDGDLAGAARSLL
jgi:pimeloyl-ACP methyl ester carboxylesterase